MVANRIVVTGDTKDGEVLSVIAEHAVEVGFSVVRAQALAYAALNPGKTVAIESNSQHLCPWLWRRYWWNRNFPEDAAAGSMIEEKRKAAAEARLAERQAAMEKESDKRKARSMVIRGRRRY